MSRDRSIDTAAGVLILLVVFGHAIEPLRGGPSEALLQWIFLFHMPAFVFLSGYLTRRAGRTSRTQLAARLLLPYAVFVGLHSIVEAIVTGEPWDPSILNPPWTLWYLLALLVWRLAAPLLRRMPAAVLVTACAALLVGTLDLVGTELSLSRIVAFAPLFTAGLLWKDEWWARLRTTPVRIAAAAALLAALAWSVSTYAEVNRGVLFLSGSYGDLGVVDATGIAQRAAVLVTGGVLTLAVLSFSGPAWAPLSRIGAATLPVYLLHPLVLYPAHVNGYPDAWPESVLLPGLAAGAVAFAWLVTGPRAIALTRPLMDSRWWSARLSGLRG